MHFEVVAGDGPAQVVLEAETIAHAGVHVGIEHLVPCLAARLGVIHGGIGIAHDFVGAVVAGRPERDADAGRREHFASADRERRSQGVLNPERDRVGLAVVAEALRRMANSSPPRPAGRLPAQAQLETPDTATSSSSDQMPEAIVDNLNRSRSRYSTANALLTRGP